MVEEAKGIDDVMYEVIGEVPDSIKNHLETNDLFNDFIKLIRISIEKEHDPAVTRSYIGNSVAYNKLKASSNKKDIIEFILAYADYIFLKNN